ncbi:MAG: hypothetical protein H6734_09600 [Alphaproteobacteria bacterium]|nr:hypothetical protein [Alphaproteobacteria bacterium]
MILLALTALAGDAQHPSHFDLRVGTGLMQVPSHVYTGRRLAWPRVNVWITGLWELPGSGGVQPVFGLHTALGGYLWEGGPTPFDTGLFRLEPRGGGRIDLVERLTLDLTLGAAFDRTTSTRAGAVLASSLAWLSRDERWFLNLETRLATRIYRQPDDGGHLYNPGGSGFLVGVGVRY